MFHLLFLFAGLTAQAENTPECEALCKATAALSAGANRYTISEKCEGIRSENKYTKQSYMVRILREIDCQDKKYYVVYRFNAVQGDPAVIAVDATNVVRFQP